MKIEDSAQLFGARIREIREKLGWSQAELARQLGHALNREVNPLTVTRIEGGKRPVPVPEVVALATVFQMSPAQLMGDQTVDAEHVEADTRTVRYLNRLGVAQHGLRELVEFVRDHPATRGTVRQRLARSFGEAEVDEFMTALEKRAHLDLMLRLEGRDDGQH